MRHPGRILRVVRARQIEARRGFEIRAAVLAVAHAAAAPAIAEDPVHLVSLDDLLGHLSHELEVVRTQRACEPPSGHRSVAARIARRIHGDPIGVRLVHGGMRGMRVGSRDHHHSQLAAAGRQIPERVPIAEPLRTVMQGNLRRVKRHAAARAETCGIGVRPAEVIEPEIDVELSGVVLHQGELRPSHRAIEPFGRIGGFSYAAGKRKGRCPKSGCREERAAVEFRHE